MLARFYNPTSQIQPLEKAYHRTDVWGKIGAKVDAVPPKKIVTLRVEKVIPDRIEDLDCDGLESIALPLWRVGQNKGLPDAAVLASIEEKIAALELELSTAASQVSGSQGTDRLRLQHHYYVLDRERLELQLSLLLNRRKLAENGALRYEYLYKPDDEIASIGFNLNRLRIKRRIFDYVVRAI